MSLLKALRYKLPLHRIIRLRHRYLYTRHNRLRLRYVVGSVALFSLLTVSMLGGSGASIAFVPLTKHIEAVTLKEDKRNVNPAPTPIVKVALHDNPKIEYVSPPDTQDHSQEDIITSLITPEMITPELSQEDPLLVIEDPVEILSVDTDHVILEETDDHRDEIIIKNDVVQSDVIQVEKPPVCLRENDHVLETALPLTTELDTYFWAKTIVSQPEQKVQLLPHDDVLTVKSGGTIAGTLQDANVLGSEAYNVVNAMKDHYDPRTIKPGQTIAVQLYPQEDGYIIKEMRMKIDTIKEVIVSRTESDGFSAEIHKKQVAKTLKAARTEIDVSLYGSAAKSGIPASIIAEMIRIYSYEVDFQRDIRKGDHVEILYELYETEDGHFARYGNILFANLNIGGDNHPVYRFERKNKTTEYFKESGKSLKRTLMRTPVDGARMSSGFGMRRHPVLGYNKMHKGVDFAAPRGTPVYAAGDGVLEKVGRNGGYGNYVRIRHTSELKTAYAHLHKFAKGKKTGQRVKQGEVIGYVGSTGRSTGPHLHFEVLKNGKQINPKSMKTSSGQKLAGRALNTFKKQVDIFKQQYQMHLNGTIMVKNTAE